MQTRLHRGSSLMPASALNRGPDLSHYDNSWYSPGRNLVIRSLWFFLGLPILRSSLIPSSALRRGLLHIFGARIGKNVVVKPGVVVKYPWLLSVAENSWIGERVWIDNVAQVDIGADVCISQGAYLCTGNHSWSDPNFGLILGPITVHRGAWLGARSIICPAVSIGERAVVCAGAVVTKNIPADQVHAGNPATFIRPRQFRD
jgi:putative colanic acid biosynthesis acetyltransferase WcaF